MVTEMYDPELKDSLKFYSAGADMPFNFNLIELKKGAGATDIVHCINKWLTMMPNGKWPNWVVCSFFVLPLR